jgi:hypothetical protein
LHEFGVGNWQILVPVEAGGTLNSAMYTVEIVDFYGKTGELSCAAMESCSDAEEAHAGPREIFSRSGRAKKGLLLTE